MLARTLFIIGDPCNPFYRRCPTYTCSDRFWEPFVAKLDGDYLSEIKEFNVLGPLKKTLKHAFM